MSETKKRNNHLPEFKAKVGLEAVRGVKTVNQIAQEFGVHPVSMPVVISPLWPVEFSPTPGSFGLSALL